MSNARFRKLLEPGYIGAVKTRNRIIKTGAAMGLFNAKTPHLTEIAKYFYETLAKGGVGLLIVESPNFDYPFGARNNERAFLQDERDANELSELSKLIHKHGCPTFMQLYHSGIWQVYPSAWSSAADKTKPFYDGPPIGASAVSFKAVLDIHNQMPRPLTILEIKKMVDTWANTTVLAHKAGFDGIDINAGSSHLLHSFLSPFFNRRHDEYGGSLQNRARIVTEIIVEIKKRLGKDFPVIVTMNGVEVGQIIGVRDSECQTFQNTLSIARIFQEAGADAIQVRSHFLGRHRGSYMPEQLFYPESPIPLNAFPEEYDVKRKGFGSNIRLAELMKKELSIPLISVGRIDPILGEQALRNGQADFIGMNRSLVADLELPNKVISGKLADITPCTSCCTCSSIAVQKQIGNDIRRRCMVNAAFGRDYKYEIKPATNKKNVVVVGGGPAGMEAARVAALRGHNVTLYEKSSRLGGLVPIAAVVKGLEIEHFLDFARYLENQLRKLGVKTVLNQEVAVSKIQEINPDVVILAIGGLHSKLEIPGISNRKVITTDKLQDMLNSFMKYFSPEFLAWASKIWLPIGKNVVIIGGEIQGCEMAEFLAKRRRKVTIVEKGDELGKEIQKFRKLQLVEWFSKKGVKIITEVKKYEEITNKGLTIIDKEGNRQTLEADSIIPAVTQTTNNALSRSLEGRVKEVYAVGDCSQPGLSVDAIDAGSAIARVI